MPRSLDRSYLSLVPWRNFRRVFFLVLALMAVVALKKSAGGFFRNVLDSVAPPPQQSPAHRAHDTTVHLRLGPPVK